MEPEEPSSSRDSDTEKKRKSELDEEMKEDPEEPVIHGAPTSSMVVKTSEASPSWCDKCINEFVLQSLPESMKADDKVVRR